MIEDFNGGLPPRKRASMDGLRDNISGSPSAPGDMVRPQQPGDILPEPKAAYSFRTPEEVSQQESGTPTDEGQTTKGNPFDYMRGKNPSLDLGPTALKSLQAPRKKLFGFIPLPSTRKQWIITAGVAVIVLAGGGVAAYKLLSSPEPAPVVKKAPVKVVPKPKPILSPLSGLPVTKEIAERPVTGVMIENSTNARPQSGMDQASIVFEAIAEAGITRFLCLYQDNYPATLGPVRSSRPYYLDWAMAFDATYAHVGGSPDALQRIKEIGVKDLDQFYNPGPYRRISTRFAPHNMYTSLQGLADAAAAKGYTKSTFTPIVRKEKEEPSKAPTAKSINFGISSSTYNVHYDYDPATNTYHRSMGGAAHIDNETKAVLTPKVVVALAMPYSLMPDGLHSSYQTTGSGNMLVFQDGVVTAGTWSKATPKDQFLFKDAAGADIKINPGQTWFTVLKDISTATYQP